jgi:alpha-L-fucosidase 2
MRSSIRGYLGVVWIFTLVSVGRTDDSHPFAGTDLAVRRDVIFVERTGESLKLDLYLQMTVGPNPVIVHVHGGGFVGGDKKDLPLDLLQPLVKAGCSVVSVNYRLAPKHPFPAAPDDVDASIEWVKTHAAELRSDKSKIVLLGASAGGLLVSLVGARHRPASDIAGVVALYGEHDLPLRVSENPCSSDGRTFPRPPDGCISPGLGAFLGFSKLAPETEGILNAASAANQVPAGMPPYLLVHGTRDFGVPFEQSVSMQQAMLRVGAACKLVPVVGGGHGGWSTPSMQHYRTDVENWIRETLKI